MRPFATSSALPAPRAVLRPTSFRNLCIRRRFSLLVMQSARTTLPMCMSAIERRQIGTAVWRGTVLLAAQCDAEQCRVGRGPPCALPIATVLAMRCTFPPLAMRCDATTWMQPFSINPRRRTVVLQSSTIESDAAASSVEVTCYAEQACDDLRVSASASCAIALTLRSSL